MQPTVDALASLIKRCFFGSFYLSDFFPFGVSERKLDEPNSQSVEKQNILHKNVFLGVNMKIGNFFLPKNDWFIVLPVDPGFPTSGVSVPVARRCGQAVAVFSPVSVTFPSVRYTSEEYFWHYLYGTRFLAGRTAFGVSHLLRICCYFFFVSTPSAGAILLVHNFPTNGEHALMCLLKTSWEV